MLQRVADLAIAVLLGVMVFFPAVVAPLVFRTLPPEPAGRFLRALFPRYYLFMIAMSALAGMICLQGHALQAALLLAVAASTLLLRRLLVPKLNAWRDRELAGDDRAGRRFAVGHRASVVVNMLQLLVILGVAIERTGTPGA